MLMTGHPGGPSYNRPAPVLLATSGAVPRKRPPARLAAVVRDAGHRDDGPGHGRRRAERRGLPPARTRCTPGAIDDETDAAGGQQRAAGLEIRRPGITRASSVRFPSERAVANIYARRQRQPPSPARQVGGAGLPRERCRRERSSSAPAGHGMARGSSPRHAGGKPVIAAQ